MPVVVAVAVIQVLRPDRRPPQRGLVVDAERTADRTRRVGPLRLRRRSCRRVPAGPGRRRSDHPLARLVRPTRRASVALVQVHSARPTSWLSITSVRSVRNSPVGRLPCPAASAAACCTGAHSGEADQGGSQGVGMMQDTAPGSVRRLGRGRCCSEVLSPLRDRVDQQLPRLGGTPVRSPIDVGWRPLVHGLLSPGRVFRASRGDRGRAAGHEPGAPATAHGPRRRE